MAYSIRELKNSEFPSSIKEIPDPPKKLFISGDLPPEENKVLCIVGSRKCTSYGKEVCEKIIEGLSGYPISIVSGLALGIDSVAHKSALQLGLHTVAVPGSGLNENVLYPSTNLNLAREIISSGGALVSEFESDFKATPWSFPQRNRIMAGLSHAVLVIEAEEKSGTLITARLALDYNRDVFAVPGSIFSSFSNGPNKLIRLGAELVTSSSEILKTFGFEEREQKENVDYSDLSEEEIKIVEALSEPMSRDELIRNLNLSASQVNMILSAMEIKGIIIESMGELRLK